MAPESIRGAIQSAYEESQDCSTVHVKLIKNLGKLYEKARDKDDFLSIFLNFLQIPLVHGENESAINLTLEFVANFALSFEPVEVEGDDGPELDLHPFINGIFQFLIKNHGAKSQDARFRICQLINRLLHKLPEGVTLDETLYNDISEAMLARLHDRIASVRMQAVEALTRFQDVNDKHCAVIKAFRFHLKRDPHPGVRKAVLKAIAINHQTLPAVFSRCRDVREDVRVMAYSFIAQKVHVKSLSISQREDLLKAGLNDRHEPVRTVVRKKLLPNWMLVFKHSLMQLLKALDVESSVETCVTVIETLIQEMEDEQAIEQLPKLSDDRLLPLEDLSPESVLYWRCLASHLHQKGERSLDALDSILPEITVFANYFSDYVKQRSEDPIEEVKRHFIIKQLLLLVPTFDLADEAGLVNLERSLRSLLDIEDLSHMLVRPMIHTYIYLSKRRSSTALVPTFLEVIADLREPLTAAEPVPVLSEQEQRQRQLQCAKVRVQLNVAKEDLEQAVRKENFEEAQEIKQMVKSLEEKLEKLNKAPEPTQSLDHRREERNDPNTLLKCLTIFSELLQTQQKLSAGMTELLEFLILPSVQHEDPAVRNSGMEALGIFSLLDEAQAQRHMFLFVQATQIDHTAVQMTAVKAMFDLFLRYGFQTFDNFNLVTPMRPVANVGEKESSNEELFAAVSGLLDSEVVEIQSLAARGFCKLFLASRLACPKLLARLLILLYHPLSEDDVELTQVLNAFFPLYASQGREHQECLGAAFLPAYTTLIKAPISSPLSELDTCKIMQCIVGLTQPALLDENHGAYDRGESNVHDVLAQRFLREILKRPDSMETRNLARFLIQMQPALADLLVVKGLLSLCDRAQRNVNDKLALRTLEKFQNHLAHVLENLQPSQISQTTASEDRIENVSQSSETVSQSMQDSMVGNQTRRVRQLRTREELSRSLEPSPAEEETDEQESTEGDEMESEPFISPVESEASLQAKSRPGPSKRFNIVQMNPVPSQRTTRASLVRANDASPSLSSGRPLPSSAEGETSQLGSTEKEGKDDDFSISSVGTKASSQPKSQRGSLKRFSIVQNSPTPSQRVTRASLLRANEASPLLSSGRPLSDKTTVIPESPSSVESVGRLTRSAAKRGPSSVTSSPLVSSEEVIPASPARRPTRNTARRGNK